MVGKKKTKRKHSKTKKIKRKKLSLVLRKLVEQAFNGEFKEEKIEDIERLALMLMKRFNISEQDIQKQLKKSKRKEPLELIELERKIKKELLYAPLTILQGVPSFERDRERALDLVVEVRMHRIKFEEHSV